MISAKGDLNFSFVSRSGMRIKNNSTQKATAKLNKSNSKISGKPPTEKSTAANMGLNTITKLLEKEFIPLTLDSLFFGTIFAIATEDAGC